MLVYHDHREHNLLIQFLPFARGFGDRIECIVEIVRLFVFRAVRKQPAQSHLGDEFIATFCYQGVSRHQDGVVGGFARARPVTFGG